MSGSALTYLGIQSAVGCLLMGTRSATSKATGISDPKTLSIYTLGVLTGALLINGVEKAVEILIQEANYATFGADLTLPKRVAAIKDLFVFILSAYVCHKAGNMASEKLSEKNVRYFDVIKLDLLGGVTMCILGGMLVAGAAINNFDFLSLFKSVNPTPAV